MRVQKQNIENEQDPHLLHQRVPKVAKVAEGRMNIRGINEMTRPKHLPAIPIDMKDIIDVDITQEIDAVQIDIEERDLVTDQGVSNGARVGVENVFDF